MRNKLVAAVIAVATFAGLSVVAAPAANAEVCSYQKVYEFGPNGWGYYYEWVCTYSCRPGVPC